MELTFEQLKALKPHPLCQVLNSEEFKLDDWQIETLRTSLSVHGLLSHIIIDADTNEVLDGWNTLQQWLSIYSFGKTADEVARAVAAINKQIVYKKFTTGVDRLGFVAAKQFCRRNLNATQRVLAAKDFYKTIGGTESVPSLETLMKISMWVPSAMWLEFLRGVISGKITIAYYAASSIG
jgi:hypothetical protein